MIRVDVRQCAFCERPFKAFHRSDCIYSPGEPPAADNRRELAEKCLLRLITDPKCNDMRQAVDLAVTATDLLTERLNATKDPV